jgi:hypothetical protein
MACGSIITYHWQLNTFITTCDFSRVCLLLCGFQRVAGLPRRVLFGFMRKVCGLTFSLPCFYSDAVTALTVAPEDWIKTLAMWLEYNLLQATIASPFNTS